MKGSVIIRFIIVGVVDFGNLKFEKTDKEVVARTRYGDFRVVVLVVDIGDYGTDGLALTEEIAGNRLALGKKKLVLLVS